jgi:hypothetical protein
MLHVLPRFVLQLLRVPQGCRSLARTMRVINRHCW